jgi:hypothetical protein
MHSLQISKAFGGIEMGLMVHSLGKLPADYERDYYIYLLDYDWYEDLGEVLDKNFSRMAALASANDAVVLRGTNGSHFGDEVLSWHHINGEESDELLPAILITTRHPREFRDYNHKEREQSKDRMLLIPLRKACKSSGDVVNLIEKIFRDIRAKKALTDFEVAREMSRGKKGALVDALILEPNVAGVGVNLNYIINFLLGRKGS